MSRLLKEDAALLGEAYGKILLNELFPHEWSGGDEPLDIKVTPQELEGTPTPGKPDEMSYRKTIMACFANPGWEKKGAILPGFHSDFDAQSRAAIVTLFLKKFGNELRRRIKGEFGGTHPGTRWGKRDESKKSKYKEITEDFKDWVKSFTFKADRGNGVEVLTLLGGTNPAQIENLATWIVDQSIKNVFEPKGLMKYIPGPGEEGFRGGAKAAPAPRSVPPGSARLVDDDEEGTSSLGGGGVS